MLCWTVLRLQMVWADFGFLQRSWVRPGVVDIGQSCLDAAAAGAGDVLAPELLHWCIGTLVHCWRITACSCPWFWPMQWWFGAPSLLQKFSPSTSVLQEGHNPSPSAVISLKCLGIPGTMSLLPLQKNMEQCKGGWSKFAFGQFKVFGPELSTSKQTKNTSEIPKLYTCTLKYSSAIFARLQIWIISESSRRGGVPQSLMIHCECQGSAGGVVRWENDSFSQCIMGCCSIAEAMSGIIIPQCRMQFVNSIENHVN